MSREAGGRPGRIGEILRAATPRSIVILNEIFTSTTVHDARFLGTKLLTKVIAARRPVRLRHLRRRAGLARGARSSA